MFFNVTMVYPTIQLAQSLISICKSKNLTNIVISPGSRNAPLTIGFANDPFFKCYSIADERCAAFFGMGISQQVGTPTVLVCTSGSALLNYYPAVAEAFYSRIPLIILSADRPQSKIDIGDGQTIRQQNVFNNHILFSANLSENASEENDQLINKAVNIAITKSGPVHINAPFEEPLYNTINELEVNPVIIPIAKEIKKTINYNHYSSIWNKVSKKLILVGECKPNILDTEIIDFLAKDESVLFLAESISNICHLGIINAIDRLIIPFNEEELQQFQPEILITFGGMVVSKRIKQILRQYKPIHHWHIDPSRHYNTFSALTDAIEDEPNQFFHKLKKMHQPISSNYKKWATDLMMDRDNLHKNYLNTIAFCDFKAINVVLQQIPTNTLLQVSNSAVIRYVQLIRTEASINIFCNRGTSGIDGSTSTAIGAAVGSNLPTLLLTGDISFLYDSNGLWNSYIPPSFKIVIINNNGGGIFRTLPGHQDNDVFNTYFETSHHLTAKHLADMFNFKYFEANTEIELNTNLKAFYTSKMPSILEIFTPTKLSSDIFKTYFSIFKNN